MEFYPDIPFTKWLHECARLSADDTPDALLTAEDHEAIAAMKFEPPDAVLLSSYAQALRIGHGRRQAQEGQLQKSRKLLFPGGARCRIASRAQAPEPAGFSQGPTRP